MRAHARCYAHLRRHERALCRLCVEEGVEGADSRIVQRREGNARRRSELRAHHRDWLRLARVVAPVPRVTDVTYREEGAGEELKRADEVDTSRGKGGARVRIGEGEGELIKSEHLFRAADEQRGRQPLLPRRPVAVIRGKCGCGRGGGGGGAGGGIGVAVSSCAVCGSLVRVLCV
eukprot:6200339-Pleurochrysis_carterae.AAC.7